MWSGLKFSSTLLIKQCSNCANKITEDLFKPKTCFENLLICLKVKLLIQNSFYTLFKHLLKLPLHVDPWSEICESRKWKIYPLISKENERTRKRKNVIQWNGNYKRINLVLEGRVQKVSCERRQEGDGNAQSWKVSWRMNGSYPDGFGSRSKEILCKEMSAWESLCCLGEHSSKRLGTRVIICGSKIEHEPEETRKRRASVTCQ